MAPIKFLDVLGMVHGVKIPKMDVEDRMQVGTESTVKDAKDDNESVSMAVQTRASKTKVNNSSLSDTEVITADRDSFIKEQNECSSLDTLRNKINVPIVSKNRTVQYQYVSSLLYRTCTESRNPHEKGKSQLVVPTKMRPQVLKLAYESLVAGHFFPPEDVREGFSEFLLAWCHS